MFKENLFHYIDMNINIATFILSKKLINIHVCLVTFLLGNHLTLYILQ